MTHRKDSKSLTPLQSELRESMVGWGCPLCRLSDKAEHTYVDSLTYERVLDLKTRDGLKASRGVCRRHGEMWREVQGSALGIAIVYRVALLDLLRDTEAFEGRSQGLFRRSQGALAISKALDASQACPVCIIGEQTARRFGEILVQDLIDTDVQTALIACGGLCLPHLREVLALPGVERITDQLLDCHRRVWRELMGNVDEFIRKNDYRFSDEAMTEEESNSWIRTLDLLTGRRDASEET